MTLSLYTASIICLFTPFILYGAASQKESEPKEKQHVEWGRLKTLNYTPEIQKTLYSLSKAQLAHSEEPSEEPLRSSGPSESPSDKPGGSSDAPLPEGGEHAFEDRIMQEIEEVISALPVGHPTRSLIHQVVTTFTSTAPRDSRMSWCRCHPAALRLDTLLLMLEFILKTYPDRATHIGFVSIASGSFMQEYLTIVALATLGYTKLHCTCIDSNYQEALSPKLQESLDHAPELWRMFAMFKEEEREFHERLQPLRKAYPTITVRFTDQLYPYISEQIARREQRAADPGPHLVALIDGGQPDSWGDEPACVHAQWGSSIMSESGYSQEETAKRTAHLHRLLKREKNTIIEHHNALVWEATAHGKAKAAAAEAEIHLPQPNAVLIYPHTPSLATIFYVDSTADIHFPLRTLDVSNSIQAAHSCYEVLAKRSASFQKKRRRALPPAGLQVECNPYIGFFDFCNTLCSEHTALGIWTLYQTSPRSEPPAAASSAPQTSVSLFTSTTKAERILQYDKYFVPALSKTIIPLSPDIPSRINTTVTRTFAPVRERAS